MALIRATFFFEDENAYGWSETIYNQAGDISAALVNARALAIRRIPLLGGGVTLMYVRTSDDLFPGDSQIAVLNGRLTRAMKSSNGPSDIANTALQVRMQVGNNYRRILYMRGQPDALTDDSGVFNASRVPGWADLFAEWAVELVVGGWAIKSRVKSGPLYNITAITQDPANGQVTFTTNVAHGFTLNQLIAVRAIRGPNFLNGNWRTFTGTAGTTVVTQHNRFLTQWNGGGTCQTLVYALQSPLAVSIMRATHRIAGRPSVPRRGRRLATPRR